jgi:choline-sulfatase
VVFSSDHGDMLCEKGMVQKRTFYEWSARVPLLLRLPGDRYAGRRVAAPVSLVDILPTFQDLAGVPAEDRLPADGASLLELLGGDEDPDRTVYAEMHLEDTPVPCFMVRRGRYKYIHIHGVDAQLFDLATDPGEWRNLAGVPAHRAVEETLRTALLQRFPVDAIEHDVRRTIASRLLIDRAMRRTRTRWDYAPQFDPSADALRQYLPTRAAGWERRG